MKGYIKNLKPQITDEEYNQKLVPKLTEFDEIMKKVSECSPGTIDISQYDSQGSSDKERIKSVKQLKKNTNTILTLELIRDAFTEIAKHVNLEEKQQESLAAIEAEIAHPTQDDDDKPVIELTPEELKGLIHTKDAPAADLVTK